MAEVPGDVTQSTLYRLSMAYADDVRAEKFFSSWDGAHGFLVNWPHKEFWLNEMELRSVAQFLNWLADQLDE